MSNAFDPVSDLEYSELSIEVWQLEQRIADLEYRLDRIAGEPTVPQWVRDYASGKAETLSGR